MTPEEFKSELEKLGLEQTYIDLHTGLENGWLSEKKLINYINRHLEKDNEDYILEIYLAESEGKEAVLKALSKLLSHIYGNQNLINLKKESIRKWHYAFLTSITISDKAIIDKMGDVEFLYADMEYPEQWGAFIPFMPPYLTENGLEIKYDYLLKYLESEKLALGL